MEDNEYSIPVFKTKNGTFQIDIDEIEYRDNSRTFFSKEEERIIRRMIQDATQAFNNLDQNEKRGIEEFEKTPFYRKVMGQYESGNFLAIWRLLTRLLGLSEDEAIKRYCIKQSEIGEQEGQEI